MLVTPSPSEADTFLRKRRRQILDACIKVRGKKADFRFLLDELHRRFCQKGSLGITNQWASLRKSEKIPGLVETLRASLSKEIRKNKIRKNVSATLDDALDQIIVEFALQFAKKQQPKIQNARLLLDAEITEGTREILSALLHTVVNQLQSVVLVSSILKRSLAPTMNKKHREVLSNAIQNTRPLLRQLKKFCDTLE